MITGQPHAIALILDFADGDKAKQEVLLDIPPGKTLVIETVGVKALLQPNQGVMAFVAPVLGINLVTFPIALNGESGYPGSDFAISKFGTQCVTLYADERVEVGAIRHSTSGIAQVEFNINGRLVDKA